MPVRRCNQCREYFPRDDMVKLGSVFVCSTGCREEKLLNKDREKNTKSGKSTKTKPNVDKAAVRKQVIERDGSGCLVCRHPGQGLHLHRIIYGSQGGEYRVNNCIQLCMVHHAMVHTSKELWLPVEQAYLSDLDMVPRTFAWTKFRQACLETMDIQAEKHGGKVVDVKLRRLWG